MYSLINFPISEILPKSEISNVGLKGRDEGEKIFEVFQRNYLLLLNKINPEEAARYLYDVSIIDDSEHDLAMVHSTSRRERSSSLLMNLFRKLRANPQLCGAAIAALRNAGTNMDSISEALEEAGVNCVESKNFWQMGKSFGICFKNSLAHLSLGS